MRFRSMDFFINSTNTYFDLHVLLKVKQLLSSQDTFAVFINLIIRERTYIAYFKCTTFLILVKLIFPSLIRLSNFHILSLNYEISIFTIKLSYRIEKMKT